MIKRNILIPIVCILIFGSLVPVFANLLLNPSFETWTNPRTPANWTVEDTIYAKIYKESTRVFHGAYAAKFQRFQVGETNNKGILQRVAVPGRGRYIASARFYRSSDSARCGLTITWRNSSLAFISSWSTIYADTVLPTWQVIRKAAVSDTAPTGAAFADFIIRTYGRSIPTPSPSGGTFVADSVSFAAVTAIEETGNSLSKNSLQLDVKPNPFTNITQINFLVNPASFKAVKIYDATGNLVKTINSMNRNDAFFTTSWDGRNEKGITVASGIYFVALETKNAQTKTVKTLFLR